MNPRWSFVLALCLGVLVFSHADADHHKKKHKNNGGELTQRNAKGSQPDNTTPTTTKQGVLAPSSPSDETLNTGRYKPATSLGVHRTPGSEQVCPKGYWGTPPNCTPQYQKCPPYGC
jgi:hypothetical protein